jgi:hypothetical protein
VLQLITTSVLTVFGELRRKSMKGALVEPGDESFNYEPRS